MNIQNYIHENINVQPKDGFVSNIEKDTLVNKFFRKVLYTTKQMQLVVMCLQPGEDIGMEIHKKVTQFIRIESGEGRVILNGKTKHIKDDFCIVIPAGTEHNIINTSKTKLMKLYTVYTPQEHKDKLIHKTKVDAFDEKH